LTFALVSLQSCNPSQNNQGKATHQVLRPSEMPWSHDELDGPGFSHVDLFGSYGVSGLYIFRTKGPAGAILPPHWHPRDEHVTVISGTFLVGSGEKYDEHALTELPPGSHFLVPARMPHFGKNKDEVVLELTGVGFENHFVNPEDDPARKKH